jgi:hypothetical protein
LNKVVLHAAAAAPAFRGDAGGKHSLASQNSFPPQLLAVNMFGSKRSATRFFCGTIFSVISPIAPKTFF